MAEDWKVGDTVRIRRDCSGCLKDTITTLIYRDPSDPRYGLKAAPTDNRVGSDNGCTCTWNWEHVNTPTEEEKVKVKTTQDRVLPLKPDGTPTEELKKEIELPLLPVGTYVRLREDSPYKGQSEGTYGVIIDKKLRDGYDYAVLWGNHVEAFYHKTDVDAVEDLEDLAPIMKVGTVVRLKGEPNNVGVIMHVGPTHEHRGYAYLIGIRYNEANSGMVNLNPRSAIRWILQNNVAREYNIISVPKVKCPKVLLCVDCKEPCAFERHRRIMIAEKTQRDEEARLARIERERIRQEEIKKLSREVFISEKIKDFMLADVSEHRNGGYPNPMQYMLGADKNGIVVGLVPIVGRSGCKDGAYISEKQFALAMVSLARRKLVPCGMGRIGVFHPQNSVGIHEMSLNTENAIMLQYSYEYKQWACLSYSTKYQSMITHTIKYVTTKSRKGVI